MKTLRRLAFLIVLLVASTPVAAEILEKSELPASIVRIASGDTLLMEVFVSPYQRVRFPVCLSGVDTPDLNARCFNERFISQRGIDLVRDLSLGGVTVIDMAPGCYPDRPYARIRLSDGRELSEVLLEKGLGQPQVRGVYPQWCDEDDSLTHPGADIYTYY